MLGRPGPWVEGPVGDNRVGRSTGRLEPATASPEGGRCGAWLGRNGRLPVSFRLVWAWSRGRFKLGARAPGGPGVARCGSWGSSHLPAGDGSGPRIRQVTAVRGLVWPPQRHLGFCVRFRLFRELSRFGVGNRLLRHHASGRPLGFPAAGEAPAVAPGATLRLAGFGLARLFGSWQSSAMCCCGSW